MSVTTPEPLERLTFDSAELMREYPPVLRHTNKLVVFSVACGEICEPSGTLGYTRWPAMELPGRFDLAAALEHLSSAPTIFDYVPVTDMPGAVEWHVNFADPLLFYAYGSGLFAQDEMQSAEHPVLGSLVEALHVGGHRAITEDDSGPTPALVTGAERRCCVATDPNEAEGRPRGLYGNEFSAASVDVVRRATRRIDPPTISNLIALAAPSYGVGAYERGALERILVTAYTGFAAAVAESASVKSGAPVVIHSGYWGCGVFGGDRVVMSLLQILAAGMAGVDRFVFHTVNAEGAPPFDEALRIVREELAPAGQMTAGELLDRVSAMGFMWGMSNGS
ncbi:MAG: hypothetical protein JXA36_00590 [Coriobacteriia bacterium]|nr:hypothetical protein [Coriobacteriia bacterium]